MESAYKGTIGFLVAILAISSTLISLPVSNESSLLHVSFDATREVLLEIGEAFKGHLLEKGITPPNLIQSHGSSGSQARAVVAGLPADIVSLAVWPDLETVVKQPKTPLLDEHWLDAASPWFTTMVFVVRKGNPKKVFEWEDLERENISIIIPNPKVSGNGKLAFLALYGAMKVKGLPEERIYQFLKSVFSRIPVLESSSRAATLSFATKGLGDVQVTYESEAELVLREGLELEKVIPKTSIKAPLPIVPLARSGQSAQINRMSNEYIDFFNSEKAQDILAKHGFRPTSNTIARKYHEKFSLPYKFFTVEEISGSWSKANKSFFAIDGLFDKVMTR